ncbi:MAG: RHS repeat-associated core domain-containing protein [Thaumarchaeota archaeon]|nr:RHS repeat-associated core domain-containing protein [Nitrososphaerota archaeon]
MLKKARGGSYQKWVNTTRPTLNEDGKKNVYGYDWRDRLIWTREYVNSTTYYQTDQTYDKAGNILTVKDAKNQLTRFYYDDLNRNNKTTYPDNKNETKKYDQIGNLVNATDAKGQILKTSYDEQGRIRKITYPNSTTATFSFDKNGNRVSMNDLVSSTTDFYDPLNRVLSEAKTVDGSTYVTSYSYDAESRLTRLVYPDSKPLTYEYDGLDRVKSLNSTLASFTYTIDGKVKTISYGNGLQTTYSYDSRSRATRIVVKDGEVRRLDLNYTYASNGNVKNITSIGATESYGYDGLDRLTSSTGPWGTITYTYDQVGNRLTKREGNTTVAYTYGTYNRLTSTNSSLTFTYANNGNTFSKIEGGDTWNYTYNYNNMMTKAVKNGVTQGQYFYDGENRRVKVIEGSTLIILFSGLNIIYQKNVTSGGESKFLYANSLLIAKNNGSLTYYHQDSLGSTRLTTSASKLQLFASNYKPFGPQHNANSTEKIKYTGKWEDSPTKLYYFGASYYDPEIGRFTTQDPVCSCAEPSTLNRYVYANDNPLKFTDPTGLLAELENETEYVPVFTPDPSDADELYNIRPSYPPVSTGPPPEPPVAPPEPPSISTSHSTNTPATRASPTYTYPAHTAA